MQYPGIQIPHFFILIRKQNTGAIIYQEKYYAHGEDFTGGI